MKNILIAGTGSYIGDSVKRYLEQYPEEYRVDVLETIGLTPSPELFQGTDAVICVAGIAHRKETAENRPLYFKVNRDLVSKIARAAKRGGVRQFVLLSSMSVYGRETGHITKDTIPHPVNAYGKSKLQADERIKKLEDESFIFTCLRPPMVYGKGCRGNYQSLRKFAMKSPVFPRYKNDRSMIYIDNLCEFIKEAVDQEMRGLFFPQNEEYVNTSDMVQKIADLHGKKIKLTRVFNPAVQVVPIKVVKKVFGDLTYERSDLVSKYGFEESIALTEQEQAAGQSRVSEGGQETETEGRGKIGIIACALALPGEKGYTRFAYLADMLQKKGYEVDLYTSSFNHWEKAQRNPQAVEEIRSRTDYGIRLVHEPGYKKNIDVRRIISHTILAENAVKEIEKNSRDRKYDLLYAIIPDNGLAAAVTKYGNEQGIPVVIDVEDLWPESMEMVMHIPVVTDVLYYPYRKYARYAYKHASGFIGTSDEYRDKPLEYGADADLPRKTVYVGCDLDVFDGGVAEFSDGIEKDEKEFWIIYAGTLGTSYDIDTLVRAAQKLYADGYGDIYVKILGGGPLQEQFEAAAAEKPCHVDFLGYMPYEQMAAYLVKSDVTINSFVKKAAQSIVNKIGDYLAAGKPMINTCSSREFRSKVEQDGFGVNVEAENVDVLADAILQLYKDPELREQMGITARRIAEEQFDRKNAYVEIEKLIEAVRYRRA